MVKGNVKKSFGAKIISGITKSPLHFILILVCLAWMLPSVGLFISSFRPRHLIQSSGWWQAFKLPITLTLENYGKVLTQSGMGLSFFNSLLISIPATVFPILIAAFAAYAFSWMKFRGKNTLFLIIIALLVVPLQMTLIPNLKLFNMLGITGTFG
ncbi:MAG: carbohydrate ABC transporter permease, partial [Spirochaetales bacterium]|nr:carbohydrate ABC transporter permease [Spirochaetales bacterium]